MEDDNCDVETNIVMDDDDINVDSDTKDTTITM